MQGLPPHLGLLLPLPPRPCLEGRSLAWPRLVGLWLQFSKAGRRHTVRRDVPKAWGPTVGQLWSPLCSVLAPSGSPVFCLAPFHGPPASCGRECHTTLLLKEKATCSEGQPGGWAAPFPTAAAPLPARIGVGGAPGRPPAGASGQAAPAALGSSGASQPPEWDLAGAGGLGGLPKGGWEARLPWPWISRGERAKGPAGRGPVAASRLEALALLAWTLGQATQVSAFLQWASSLCPHRPSPSRPSPPPHTQCPRPLDAPPQMKLGEGQFSPPPLPSLLGLKPPAEAGLCQQQLQLLKRRGGRAAEEEQNSLHGGVGGG